MKTAILIVMAISTYITSLDPFSLTGLETYQVTGNIIEPLARTNPTTKEFIPWLAESWTVNKAANSFRVKLRPNVKFHNGRTLTAEDLKFTFDAYYKPEYKAEIWRGMFEEISEAKIIDPLTVEFKAKVLRYLAFENLMIGLRVLPKSFYWPADLAKFRGQMIGTGPFQVSRFDPGHALELKPFPQWWGKRKPDFNLLVKTVSSAKLAEQMLIKGELDQYTLPSAANLAGIQADPGKFRVYQSRAGKGEGLWIDLNLRRELFKDKNVRRALLLLWDRAGLNSKLYGGRFQIAVDTFAAKLAYYPLGKPEPFDPGAARELLRKAGWADSNKDSVLDKTVGGRRLDLSFTIVVNSAEAERWVSLYQADAAQAGVQVKIKRIEEDSQYWQMLKDAKFDAYAGQGGASESVHAVTWKTGAPYNMSGYSNKETDQLISQLETEFDPASRHALETKLIQKVRGDIAQLPGLYSATENFLLSLRLDVDPAFPTQPWRWRSRAPSL